MKFLKKNLILVICAAVVVLAIASVFYPFGVWKGIVQDAAANRYNSTSGNIQTLTNAKLQLPAFDKPLTGVPTMNLIDAKKSFNKNMDEQAAAINKNSGDANRGGRVDMDADGHVIPLLDGKKEINFLPVIRHDLSADAMQYKDDYGKVFPGWMAKLAGSAISPVPPRPEELTTAYADLTTKRNANLPPNAQLTNQPGSDQRAELEFRRQKIMETAVGINMYVDPGAFQVRPWLSTESPPTEQMIFESLVDCWFQGDVVAAISAINGDALKAVKDPKDRNVGVSPVKRLMHITVGNDALTTHLGTWTIQGPTGPGNGGPATSLFFLPSMTLGAALDPSMAAAPAAAGVAQPNTTDMARSMTGRASGADYDVVLMQISLDIDPAYLNKFIDQLYRRNMGYTVLSVRSRTVDPLDRASNGFIYGETQVAEVELLVEGLLFRTWTQPIMPDATRVLLGVPVDAKK